MNRPKPTEQVMRERMEAEQAKNTYFTQLRHHATLELLKFYLEHGGPAGKGEIPEIAMDDALRVGHVFINKLREDG